MAITLYIMRHGHATAQAATDAQRPLSGHGVKEVESAAAHLAGVVPDVFWASPYLRAQQTAEIIKEAAELSIPFETIDTITPDDHPAAVAQALSELGEKSAILMVSHNPLVSALVSWLVDGHYQGGYGMQTANIACLEFDEVIGPGLGVLQWLK